MKIFGKRNEKVEPDRERLPKTRDRQCLGNKCVNWAGVECLSYDDLLIADGKSGGTDLPPFKDESTYAIYGRICTAVKEWEIVGVSAVVLSSNVNPLKLVALGGMFGDYPLTVETDDQITQVTTQFSSERTLE